MLPAARRRFLLLGGATVAPALLAGCGFALRQPPRLAFASIAFTGFGPRSPMALALRRAIAAPTVVVDDPARAEVVLQALEDRRDKTVVASTAAAQVREVQLRVRLAFRAHMPGGRELLPRAQLLLERDMSTSETAALAKEREEEELFREMQADIVQQVLRRLAAIRL